MARLSRVKSPEKDAEESSEIDSDALGASSPLGKGGDGKIHHLGSDLPDLRPPTSNTQESDADVDDGPSNDDMDNAESREATNDAIHAIGDEIKTRQAAGGTKATRLSTGKLKRPSDSLTNPAYRNPVLVPAGQRRLGNKNPIRKSAYDFDESPEKQSPVKLRAQDKMLQFSPTRKERTQQQQLEQSERLIESSPRRSTRTRKVPVNFEPRASLHDNSLLSLPHTPHVNQEQYEEEEEEEEEAQEEPEDTHQEMFRDFVPAHVVAQYQEQEAAGGAIEDGEDGIEVAMNNANADGDAEVKDAAVEQVVEQPITEEEVVDTAKGKAGRPKKRSSGRKPGRPPKQSTGEAEAPQELRRSPRKPKAAARASNADEVQTTGEQAAKPKRKSTRTSSGAQSAVEELRRRRSQQHQFDDVNEEPVAELDSDLFKASKGERVRAQNLTGKDLFSSSTVDDSLFVAEDAGSQEQPNQSKKRKRESPRKKTQEAASVQQGADAHKSLKDFEDYPDEEGSDQDEEEPATKKRRGRPRKSAVPLTKKVPRNSDATQNEEAAFVGADNNAPVNHRRFFGQWSALRNVFQSLQLIGSNVVDGERQPQRNIELKDDDIQQIVRLIKDARQSFVKLQHHTGEQPPDNDPATIIEDIQQRVYGLMGFNEEYPTNFKDRRKSIGIYFHLIPALTKLVRTALLAYESMDEGEVPEGQITIWHLKNIDQFLELILRLENVVDKRYTKPSSDLAIVQPVHNNVAVPLRKIKLTFARHIQDYEYGLEATRRREEAAAQRALRLEQDERRSRQEDRIRALREKWKRLHDERIWAEGGIMRREKREHLQIPDHFIEMDQNGMPFEREEVFHTRVGPPPGLVDAATAVEWTLPELSALIDGLKQYAGRNVYEKIFRRYCGRGRELNRFNVTEIVVNAAGMKEGLTQSQTNDYGDVEEWITKIPVWTKGHHALGKENDDSLVNEEAEA